MDNGVITDILLILHFVGLMLGAGGGFGSAVSMAYANKLPPEQQSVVRGLGPILGRMATIGLVVLLITGPGLVSLKYGGFDVMPVMFWVKMIFVATLTTAGVSIEFIYAQIKKGNMKGAALLPRLGPMAGTSSLLAVLFAVLAFH